MLNIRRLGHALGAEVLGLDLAQNLSDQTVAELRQAWLDNIVLCIRGRPLEPAAQVAFCSRFGPLQEGAYSSNLASRPDFPAIYMMVSKPIVIKGETFRSAFADEWHSDQSFSDKPGVCTFLNAHELPDVGGDTMFTNMYVAFETLSPTLQGLLETMSGIHDNALLRDFNRQTPEAQAEWRRLNPPVVHPVVRVHPETGRKALFVGSRLRRFLGMTEEESKPLIDFLNVHAVRYEFVYRHRWALGDMVMWDNRCSMHYAVQDYDHGQMRKLQRCLLQAPKSGYLYDGNETGPPARDAQLVANS